MKQIGQEIYELYHRQLKAAAMADVLQAKGFTSQEARSFSLLEWKRTAELAVVIEPHSQETIDLIVRMLQTRERLRITDPFESPDE